MTFDELTNVLRLIFPASLWPKPLHIFQGFSLVDSGHSTADAAKSVGTNRATLERAYKAPDPAKEVLGIALRETDKVHQDRARQILGQLLLGRCAEVAFENIYTSEMAAEDFELKDLREGRTDTDYRLYNGRGRPVYRINIKFHGSSFRSAVEFVNLEPEDCFALATYKIYSALEKQEQEELPYFFAIVGVPDLTGAAVGQKIPSLLIEAVALIDQAPKGKAKRKIEDAVIEHLVRSKDPAFIENLSEIMGADWYMLSARRAERLLYKLLFDRVFALRVRAFTRTFRGAEVDMHFSLSNDLTLLRSFLRALREDGPQKVTTLMERGDY